MLVSFSFRSSSLSQYPSKVSIFMSSKTDIKKSSHKSNGQEAEKHDKGRLGNAQVLAGNCSFSLFHETLGGGQRFGPLQANRAELGESGWDTGSGSESHMHRLLSLVIS